MRLKTAVLSFILLAGIGLTLLSHQIHAQTNACREGDTNHDGKITLADFETWRRIFKGGSATASKRLLLHNWPGGASINPVYVRDNLAWLETERDFLDGVVVAYEGSAEVMTNQPTTYETYMSRFAPMRGLSFTKLKHNFVVVYNNRPADMFDDWSVALQNWKNLARAAKDSGFTGIFFDNEEYFEYWGDWPDWANYKTKSLKEYQDQTRLRGKQVMEAIVSVFPNVHIITTIGPYISEPKSAAAIPEIAPFIQYNELKGPFFAGFLEGKGTGGAQVIDGTELYFLRTPEEFNTTYQWQKSGIASNETNSAFIPSALRPIWTRDISIGESVYNQTDIGTGDVMNPAVYEATIRNALRRSDQYVWLYTDLSNFINSGSPQMSNEWRDAARRAKATYNTSN